MAQQAQNKSATAVNEISLAFGLTKEESAQICNVRRIFDLLVIARAWIGSGFTADRERLHEPVLGNQSVFDLLNKPEIDKERILFAGSRLNMLSPAKDELSDPFAYSGCSITSDRTPSSMQVKPYPDPSA